MFLRKYFTTVTESTVTDSGRGGPGERLGSQPEIKNDSPFALLQCMTSSLVLGCLHTKAWDNKPNILCQISSLLLQFFIWV